jgi:hypothetical protein
LNQGLKVNDTMKKLTFKETLDLIAELENSFPIDQLIYEDFNVWPFIKTSITNKILNSQHQDQTASSTKNIKQRIGDVFSAFAKLKEIRQNIRKEKKIKYDEIFNSSNSQNRIIYLSNSSHRTQTLDGKHWNPFSDSFASTIEHKENIAIIEFSDLKTTKEPAFEKIIHGNQLCELAKYRRQKKILLNYVKAVFDKNERIKSSTETDFLKRIKELNLDRYFDFSLFLYEIQYVQALRIEMRIVFKKLKPEYIAYAVFYSLESFASTLACKDLKIKSIEVQHGLYNKIFYQLPAKNYDLLPNYFFSWNKEQSMIVNNWAKNNTRHKAFPFGISSLSFWMKNRSVFKNEHSTIIEQIIKTNQSLLFITFTFSESIEEQLTDLIIKSKNEMFWFLRLHPRLRYHNLDEFIDTLKSNNCSNYNIENSTKTPMYPLLECTDFHITSSSSVVMEGLMLDIPSIIINDAGKELYYNDYKENPLIYFTQNNTEILEIIKQKGKRTKITSEQTNIIFENFIKKNDLQKS